MAVYVDPMASCVPNKNWKWNRSCHMFADTENELHVLARKIGLLRSWYQVNGRLNHYDLTASKRVEAIAAGAVEVSQRQMVEFMRGSKIQTEAVKHGIVERDTFDWEFDA